MAKISLTGIKPTGYAHLGNYFGAIRPAIEMSKNEVVLCMFFIADYHALTTLKTKQELQEYSYNIACTWLACGLDPEKVIFYRQSDISEICELNWILNNVTPKGLMNRAHAYKAAVDKNLAENLDKDAGVNMGLYCYPVLMAADILLFGSNYVPVGQDQKQHVEIARDIANAFNFKYGKTFTEPECLIQQNTCTLVGLDGRKMSKSYGNTIQLFTTEAQLKKSINKIVTDCKLPGEPKDLDCTINTLYKIFATEDEAKQFETSLQQGLGWGKAKEILFEKANEYLSPMREKFDYYMAHKDEVDAILSKGAEKAKKIAQKNMAKVRKAIGL